MRIGGTRRNPSASPSPSSSSYPGTENLWGNLGFVIGVSVVACIPMTILGMVLGGIISSFIPGFVLAILLSLGMVYLLREMPRTALLLPAAATSMFLLGYAISNAGKPSPRELAVAKKEGKRFDALQQGKAVGQCKDQWERGVTAVGVKDIFRQSWWDAAGAGQISQSSSAFERLATSVNSCLEMSPPGLSKAQATLAFDPSLGLYPISLSDIHTTIAIATKAFELGAKKSAAQATGDELYQLSIKVRQLDSIGRDPNSTPNTRIGKIPGTGLGM